MSLKKITLVCKNENYISYSSNTFNADYMLCVPLAHLCWRSGVAKKHTTSYAMKKWLYIYFPVIRTRFDTWSKFEQHTLATFDVGFRLIYIKKTKITIQHLFLCHITVQHRCQGLSQWIHSLPSQQRPCTHGSRLFRTLSIFMNFLLNTDFITTK